MSTFKKCQVVMLSTNEKANIYYLTAKSKEFKDLRYSKEKMPIILDSENFHIYILSDDEIKEGDWFINFNNIPTKFSETNGGTSKYIKDNCLKIIATTDESLLFKLGGLYPVSLPQPSQSFIEKYVESYNKGMIITNVMIEYEEYDNGYLIQSMEAYETALINCRDIEQRLKINPKDNTITIKRVKNSWNKEEVRDLLDNLWDYVMDNNHNKSNSKEYNKWIEQNL